jgi:hypothetical protein
MRSRVTGCRWDGCVDTDDPHNEIGRKSCLFATLSIKIRSPLPSCFAVFVDQVPAAAQAARTARVSCGVACSGHGPRSLAALMTRRSLTAMSS